MGGCNASMLDQTQSMLNVSNCMHTELAASNMQIQLQHHDAQHMHTYPICIDHLPVAGAR